MLEHIYICRHGFRSNWVDPTIKTGPTGMNRDPPLAAYGTAQARNLAQFLSNPTALSPYPVPERVFSSPFYRCIETALPTWQALRHASGGSSGGTGLMLEHGVQEWYSRVNPDTGLHPRPADPSHLAPLFPPNSIDESYTSTLFPSRRGETLSELQDRADTFIEAWTARVEEMGVKCVVIFAHGASVIALGRALTGDKELEVSAGCASTSLYKRKSKGKDNDLNLTTSRSTFSLNAANTLLEMSGLTSTPIIPPNTSKSQITPIQTDGEEPPLPCGVGEWDSVWRGRADYLQGGVERDWSFNDIVVVDGEVITDNGDKIPHPPEDQIPTGLAVGMDKYLRRGIPPKNGQIKEVIEKSGGMTRVKL